MSLELRQVLESRLHFMEHYVKQGVFAGELDSIELEQLRGQVKELKFVIQLLESNKITGMINEVV